MKWRQFIPALVAGLALIAPRAVMACSVCGGEEGSPMVEGAESGVLVMLAVTYALLIGCAGLSAMWFVKARRRVAAAGQSDPSES